MQAISYAGHEKLVKHIAEMLAYQWPAEKNLPRLGNELDNLFLNYQDLLGELRQVIMKYNSKKKELKNELKRLLREDEIRVRKKKPVLEK